MEKTSRKISRNEMKLFLASGVVIGLILALGAWRSYVNAIPDVKIPTPKMPSPNAYDFYIQAGQAIIPAKPAVDAIEDRVVVPETQWKKRYPTANKEAWLRRNAKALNLLRQGFKHECLVPPLRSRNSKLWGANAKSLREIARMLSVESHARSERGDWNGAAKSALDTLRLGNDVSQGGALLDFLNSAPINAFGRRDLWKILPHLTIAETKTATRRLEEITTRRVSFADIMREEKYEGQAGLLEYMRSGKKMLIVPKTGAVPDALNAVSENLITPRRTVFNNYSGYMDALIARAAEPYMTKTKLPAVPNDIYSHFLAPTYERPRWNYARDEVGNDLLLVALALRAYRLENKNYPQTLNQLVPRYLKKIPQDSFGTGEALRYKLSGAEYSLYSVGPDGIDNQGRAIEDTKAAKAKRFLMQPDSKGDFVAGINR